MKIEKEIWKLKKKIEKEIWKSRKKIEKEIWKSRKKIEKEIWKLNKEFEIESRSGDLKKALDNQERYQCQITERFVSILTGQKIGVLFFWWTMDYGHDDARYF